MPPGSEAPETTQPLTPAMPPAPPTAPEPAAAPGPGATPPRRSLSCWLIGCAFLVLFLGAAAIVAVGFTSYWRFSQEKTTVTPSEPKSAGEGVAPKIPPWSSPKPPEVGKPPNAMKFYDKSAKSAEKAPPADDATRDARKVVEAFIAADKKHDGNEMAKYLTGEAAADFRPDIQGQGDAEVVDEEIARTDVFDAKTIHFQVKTVFKDLATGATNDVYDWHLLKKTDNGWKISRIDYGE